MCSLSKHIDEKPVFLGNGGTEYPFPQYARIEKDRLFMGKKYLALPKFDEPFTFTYSRKYRFKCCETCNCTDKIQI